MTTIFEQALRELDDVKRGLSTSNAKLFAQTISAAEKAEEALKTFISASEVAKSSLAEMLKVQSILEGRSAKSAPATRRSRGSNAVVLFWHAPKGTETKTPEWRSDKRGAGPSWYREAKSQGDAALKKLEVKN